MKEEKSFRFIRIEPSVSCLQASLRWASLLRPELCDDWQMVVVSRNSFWLYPQSALAVLFGDYSACWCDTLFWLLTSKFVWSCRQCWNHPVKKLSKAYEILEYCSGCKVPGGFAPSLLLRHSHVIRHLVFDKNNYKRTAELTNNSKMMSERRGICQWIVWFTLRRGSDVVQNH